MRGRIRGGDGSFQALLGVVLGHLMMGMSEQCLSRFDPEGLTNLGRRQVAKLIGEPMRDRRLFRGPLDRTAVAVLGVLQPRCCFGFAVGGFEPGPLPWDGGVARLADRCWRCQATDSLGEKQ